MPVSTPPRKRNKKAAQSKPAHRQTLRDELMGIDLLCVEALAKAAAVTSMAIKNKPNAEQTTALIPVSKIVARDVVVFKGKLDAIRRSIPDQLRRSNVDHKIKAVSINQEYQMWLDRFATIMEPNLEQISKIING